MDGVVVLYGLMGGVNVDGPLLAMILGKFHILQYFALNQNENR